MNIALAAVPIRGVGAGCGLLDRVFDRLSSGERHGVTCSHRSWRFDHGVYARTGELTGIADLNPVMPSECPEDLSVFG